MRSYARNSPQAAARIVALVLIADGNVCRSEFDAVHLLNGPHDLGLPPDGLPMVVQALCEDLLMAADARGALMAHLDEAALASLMAEVDEPALQRLVLRLAVAAARADRHLADGEVLILAAARRFWGLEDGAEAEPVVASA